MYAVLQNFAQTLMIHIPIQTTTWHNVGGLFRIGDTDYRAAYTPLCIIYLWQLKNHHQILSSDVPVMLSVTGNTVQEFGKIESIQSP